MKRMRPLITLVIAMIITMSSGIDAARIEKGRNQFTRFNSKRRDMQFFADQCNPPLPNNNLSDDARRLRACIAAMPTGATMNLDGSKRYYFASHSSTDPVWGKSANCEISLRSGQALDLNGATITPSAAEQAVRSDFVICAGSPTGTNTPLQQYGAAGNFIQINNTSANAKSVTVSPSASGPNNGGTAPCSGVACAGQFRAGDYIYIDYGCNAVAECGGDVDVFVGWDQVCGNGNRATGVIPLCYPLLKRYSAANGYQPRIFDYNTSVMTVAGGFGGRMAANITIENGTINSGMTNGILLEGTVGALVTHINEPNMNPLAGSGFLFANNNHLSVISYDSVRGPGCTGDSNFNAGEFTSSMNTIAHNTAVITGVGCNSTQGEKVFGDSEGDEGNHYSYNTATILAGGSANPGLSSCDYAYNTWGDTFDHERCTSAYTGFIDGPAGTSGQAGPTSVTNGTYVAANNNLTMQVPRDQAIGNTIIETRGGIAVYLLGRALISDNSINIENINSDFGAIALQSGVVGNTVYNSVLKHNVLNCLVSSGCKSGIYLEDPGELLSSARLTISGQTFSGFKNNIDLLGSARSHLPELETDPPR
jgi:hypothetical protein